MRQRQCAVCWARAAGEPMPMTCRVRGRGPMGRRAGESHTAAGGHRVFVYGLFGPGALPFPGRSGCQYGMRELRRVAKW